MAVKLGDALVYVGAELSNLDKDFKTAKGRTDGWASKLGGSFATILGGAVVAGAAAAAAALVGIGVKAFDVAGDVDNAARKMEGALNVTGDRARELAQVALQAWGGGFADSIEQGADAVTAAIQALGSAADDLTDDALTRLVEQGLAVQQTFGQDLSETMRTVGILLKTGVAKDAQEAMDIIAAGFQNGLDSANDLLDTFNEYADDVKDLGLSGEEFLGVLNRGLEAGAFNTDKLGDALNEFGVRLRDPAIGEQLAMLDSGISNLFEGFQSGEVTERQALQGMVSRLQAIEDPIRRDQLGVLLFGSMWEDLGETAVLAAFDMEAGLINVGGATDKLKVQYSSLGDFIQGVWRRFMVALEPVSSALLELANAAVPLLEAAFQRLEAFIVPFLNNVSMLIRGVRAELGGISQVAAQSQRSILESQRGDLQSQHDANLEQIRAQGGGGGGGGAGLGAARSDGEDRRLDIEKQFAQAREKIEKELQERVQIAREEALDRYEDHVDRMKALDDDYADSREVVANKLKFAQTEAERIEYAARLKQLDKELAEKKKKEEDDFKEQESRIERRNNRELTKLEERIVEEEARRDEQLEKLAQSLAQQQAMMASSYSVQMASVDELIAQENQRHADAMQALEDEIAGIDNKTALEDKAGEKNKTRQDILAASRDLAGELQGLMDEIKLLFENTAPLFGTFLDDINELVELLSPLLELLGLNVDEITAWDLVMAPIIGEIRKLRLFLRFTNTQLELLNDLIHIGGDNILPFNQGMEAFRTIVENIGDLLPNLREGLQPIIDMLGNIASFQPSQFVQDLTSGGGFNLSFGGGQFGNTNITNNTLNLSSNAKTENSASNFGLFKGLTGSR